MFPAVKDSGCLALSPTCLQICFPPLSPNFVSICLAILPPCVFHLVPNLFPSSFVAASPALSFTVSPPVSPTLFSRVFPTLSFRVPLLVGQLASHCVSYFVFHFASTLSLTVSSALSPACLTARFSLFRVVPATLFPPTLSSASSPSMSHSHYVSQYVSRFASPIVMRNSELQTGDVKIGLLSFFILFFSLWNFPHYHLFTDFLSFVD